MKKVIFIASMLLAGLYANGLQAQSCCAKKSASKTECTAAKTECQGASSASVAATPWTDWTATTAQPKAGYAKTVSQPITNTSNGKSAICDPSKCDVKNCDPSKCTGAGKCDLSKCAKGNGAKAKTKTSQI